MLKLKILKNRLNKVKNITNSQFLVILIQFKAIGSFSVDVPCISQKTCNAAVLSSSRSAVKPLMNMIISIEFYDFIYFFVRL